MSGTGLREFLPTKGHKFIAKYPKIGIVITQVNKHNLLKRAAGNVFILPGSLNALVGNAEYDRLGKCVRFNLIDFSHPQLGYGFTFMITEWMQGKELHQLNIDERDYTISDKFFVSFESATKIMEEFQSKGSEQ